jgi:hypothetical protein
MEFVADFRKTLNLFELSIFSSVLKFAALRPA